MDYDEILLVAEERMEKSVEHLKNEYRGMRTGRAHPGLVENVRVDYYGSPTPLKQLANISASDPTMLVIKPFDQSALGGIEKAILASDVGITPANDGKLIRLKIPALSEERRRQLVQRAREVAEEARVSVRNLRRDGNKHADGLKSDLPEDDLKALKDEVEELTKSYIHKIDELMEAKSKELMAI